MKVMFLFSAAAILIMFAAEVGYTQRNLSELREQIHELDAKVTKQTGEIINIRSDCEIAVREARADATAKIAAVVELVNGGQRLAGQMLQDIQRLATAVEELSLSVRPVQDKVTALAKSVKYMEQQLMD